MFHKVLAQGFFIFSILAGFLSFYGWFLDDDIWLASAQWLQMAVYLLLVAIYVRISEADDVEELRERAKANAHHAARKRKTKAKK